MRKWQKNKMLEFINSFHQANEEIKTALEEKKITQVQNMLAECQEYAITLGNFIEEIEGEGFITVSYVEGYCEILYHTYENLDGDSVPHKLYKALKKQVIKIENSIKNDIPIRKEMVFLPYKASMWDSMESVYLAAKEDPKCDAYCIPIPYFDLKPDRSLGEIHYEGGEYPANIEVVDWQNYDFEERRPDVICIHNPYDNWNVVTSVHPKFYSKNLKKYTDELVYIPYFVTQEIHIDNKEAINRIKHFCFLPGIIYADKVIVQSESIRQIYIEEYIKEAIANNILVEKEQLKKKILGLGSPKFDKVLNAKREDYL